MREQSMTLLSKTTSTWQLNGTHKEGSWASRRDKKTLFIALPENFQCDQCSLWLWSHVISLTHLSSAGLIIAIEEFFRDLDILGIEIRYPNGKFWPVPYIFEIFGSEDEDADDDGKKGETEPGRRWLTNYKQPDETGTKYKRMCCRENVLPRLQCIELYIHATVAQYARGPETPRCSLTHFPLGW